MPQFVLCLGYSEIISCFVKHAAWAPRSSLRLSVRLVPAVSCPPGLAHPLSAQIWLSGSQVCCVACALTSLQSLGDISVGPTSRSRSFLFLVYLKFAEAHSLEVS